VPGNVEHREDAVTAPTELHAPWCTGGCPRWLGADAPTCLPYPCQCAKTKNDAPQWRKDYGNVQCWWRKKTGGVASRCPCWGSERDGKPGDCCAHHSANPRYVIEGKFTVIEPDAQLELAAEVPDEADGRPFDADEVAWEDRMAWEPERPERKPYVPRWPKAELVCAHADEHIPKSAVHCSDCCEHFGTQMVADMHRPSWSRPCRSPFSLVDVDTGDPLVYQDADGVWRMRWLGTQAA
jgi:hypothetical protein